MAEKKPLSPSTERAIEAALASSEELIKKLNQEPTQTLPDLNTILTGTEKPTIQHPKTTESPLNDVLSNN